MSLASVCRDHTPTALHKEMPTSDRLWTRLFPARFCTLFVLMTQNRYTVRTLPADCKTDARGLTLLEAFTRMMALSGRQYRFMRTGWVTHLAMTPKDPGEPDFQSKLTGWAAPREDIMQQVCAHGLGQFEMVTDEQYRREVLGGQVAA